MELWNCRLSLRVLGYSLGKEKISRCTKRAEWGMKRLEGEKRACSG